MKNKKIIFGFTIFFIAISICFSKVEASSNTYSKGEVTYNVDNIQLEDIVANNANVFNVPDYRILSEPTQESSKAYYYNQLKSDVSKSVYNSLKSDLQASGRAEAVLTNQKFPSTDLSESGVLKVFKDKVYPYAIDAIEAFIEDNPFYYWYARDLKINLTYYAYEDTKQVQIDTIEIQSSVLERSDFQNFKNKLEEVASQTKADSIWDTTKNIHDYICKNVKYLSIDGTEIEQTAYGALVNKQAVCEGMASLFTLLCRENGIIAINVCGYAGTGEQKIGHAWNYVYHPEDQKWYAVDTTWDNIGDTTKASYTYFMIGGNTKVDQNTTFNQNHFQGVKVWNVQTYTPTAPTLSLDEYEYFKGTISYSTKDATKNNVIVTIKTNRQLEPLEGWQLSSDKLTISKEYEANTTENIIITNTRKENLKAQIIINNIDKTAPVLNISYSTTEITNRSVDVTIKSNKQVQQVSGWNLSEDKLTLTKTYIENTVEDIEVLDLLGNKAIANISITNIKSKTPICKIDYSKSLPTTQDVNVKITADRQIKQVEGWQLSSNEKELTKTYTQNKEESINIEDLDGNITVVKIKVENIDRQKPILNIEYSNKELTNKDVTVQIIANEKIKQINGWKISQDEKTIEKDYSSNNKETIKVEDLAGNISQIELTIENIDKVAPNVEVNYSTTELADKVTVTIKSNKQIKQIDGWNLSEDKKVLTKEFTQNAVEQLKIEDLAGNITQKDVKVGNIKTENSDKNQLAGNINNANTSNIPIPKAGQYQLIAIFVFCILIIATIFIFIKYKKYKKMKL